MKFTRKGFLGFGGAFIAGSAFAATLAGGATDAASILKTVNDRLAGEFISHDGLILDYVGDIPTPEEIADLKPNAMGWWCPIENGSMFTGEWLPALMAEGLSRKTLVETCVRGLIKMSEVSDVPGFIARGTGTDGRSHHPCGSNDQTDPWFLGLCEYCRWPHADAALKAKALKRLVFVAKALEANAWGVPCDGPFKGQNRGNLNAKKMPFWGKTRLMYSLKSLQTLTGDVHWGKVYDEIKAGALDEIEAGGEVDAKMFKACYGGGVWIYLSSAEALKRLIEMEENPSDRARMRKGFLRYAERVAPLMKDRTKYANTTERPFKYANWRTGYRWRVQKTQKEAESVAYSGKPEILGTRKDYERVGMANPLAAAAVCALQGDAKFRDEIRATLKHYDYSTPNVSEFFHAAIAAAALGRDAWRATPEEIAKTPAWMTFHAQRAVDTNEVVVADAPRDMKLFLLVGQSNMAGRGAVSEEDAKPIARCLKLNRDGKWAEASTPLHFDRATSGYSIANTFVIRYLAEHPADTVGLIPCAVGGSLSVTWSPEDAPDPVGTNFRRALARAREAQKNGKIVGILWHQGESDIGYFGKDPLLKERYAARLGEMARRFRSELNCPDAPFLVGEIGTLPKDCTAMNPILAEAVRGIPNATLVKASDLTGHMPDGIHFDTPSYKTLGARYYDAWLRAGVDVAAP